MEIASIIITYSVLNLIKVIYNFIIISIMHHNRLNFTKMSSNKLTKSTLALYKINCILYHIIDSKFYKYNFKYKRYSHRYYILTITI